MQLPERRQRPFDIVFRLVHAAERRQDGSRVDQGARGPLRILSEAPRDRSVREAQAGASLPGPHQSQKRGCGFLSELRLELRVHDGSLDQLAEGLSRT